jgi:hypothetical protein
MAPDTRAIAHLLRKCATQYRELAALQQKDFPDYARSLLRVAQRCEELADAAENGPRR